MPFRNSSTTDTAKIPGSKRRNDLSLWKMTSRLEINSLIVRIGARTIKLPMAMIYGTATKAWKKDKIHPSATRKAQNEIQNRSNDAIR